MLDSRYSVTRTENGISRLHAECQFVRQIKAIFSEGCLSAVLHKILSLPAYHTDIHTEQVAPGISGSSIKKTLQLASEKVI